MNMVDLVLTVCLLSNPGSCRQEHLYFEFSGSLVRCMFLAQPEIAKWAGSHPDKKVVRWECKFPETEKKI